MRCIGTELTERLVVRLDSTEHRIHRDSEVLNLVLGLWNWHAISQRPAADVGGVSPNSLDRSKNSACEQPCRDTDQQREEGNRDGEQLGEAPGYFIDRFGFSPCENHQTVSLALGRAKPKLGDFAFHLPRTSFFYENSPRRDLADSGRDRVLERNNGTTDGDRRSVGSTNPHHCLFLEDCDQRLRIAAFVEEQGPVIRLLLQRLVEGVLELTAEEADQDECTDRHRRTDDESGQKR